MLNITDAEAAYIAGFVDGEGTINVLRTAKKRFLAELSIGQIDPRPLVWIKEICGGAGSNVRVYVYKNRPTSKPIWLWAVQGEKFDQIIEKILPYLIVKKDKAEIAIKMRELIKGKGAGGSALLADELMHRMRLVSQSKELSQ